MLQNIKKTHYNVFPFHMCVKDKNPKNVYSLYTPRALTRAKKNSQVDKNYINGSFKPSFL